MTEGKENNMHLEEEAGQLHLLGDDLMLLLPHGLPSSSSE
jgi:hypothetical protein